MNVSYSFDKCVLMLRYTRPYLLLHQSSILNTVVLITNMHVSLRLMSFVLIYTDVCPYTYRSLS